MDLDPHLVTFPPVAFAIDQANALEPLYCNRDSHYNELASLYLTDSDTAIKQLFHFRYIAFIVQLAHFLLLLLEGPLIFHPIG